MSTTPDDSSRFASPYLSEGRAYSRAELRELVGTTDSTIGTGVFRPSGYNSVWLFIAEQDSQSPGQPGSTDILIWKSQLSRHNTQLIINHEPRGLELLVFYRENTAKLPIGGFQYRGRFEYQSHVGTNPALFTLARSGSMPSIEAIQLLEDKQSIFNPATIREGREWVLASIVRRRGQAAFRASLLNAYAGTCPITGCQIEPLLEAAHIIPYLGTATNHIQNGLPLRADIHTLFDLQLLAVDPESLTVLLAPVLVASEYGVLEGCSLRLPAQLEYHPSREALRTHRIRCAF